MKVRAVFPLMIFLLFCLVGFGNNERSLENIKNLKILAVKSYNPETAFLVECPTEVTNNAIFTSDPVTICEGNVVSFIGSEPAITPHTDSTFQWQSKTIAGIWEDIPGATNINYTTVGLSETTSFRRLVQFVDCADLFTSNEIQITVHQIPTAPTITLKDSCGVSILTASGYTGALSWSTGEITESISVIVAGNYSVTQTIDGCTSNAASVTASPKAIPAITNVTETNPAVCEGFGSLGFTFSNVPDGTYDVDYDAGSFSSVSVVGNSATVQASAGVYNNLTIIVNECISANGVNANLSDPNPPPTPTITLNDSCGGSILTASDYTGTLSWSTGESTESITVVVAGNYSVTQTIDGCTSNAASITASPKAIPAITNVTETNPAVCEGQGSLEFTFTGVPNGARNIFYDGGSFTNVAVTNSSASVHATAGIYNNLYISVDGCSSANGINANLTDPNPPPTPTITVQNNCGESILTASNYTGTLAWSTGESTPSITVTSAGDYSLTQNVGGCTSDAATATATPKSVPVITNVAENDPIFCQGSGALGFTFTGVPSGTYNIEYDGSSFSNVLVILNSATVLTTAGTYSNLKITINGCTSANGVNASLSDPNPPATPSVSVQNNCGESVLTASNYTGSLSWSTGESTPSIIVTTAGDYSVTQTIDGCTSDAAIATATPKVVPSILNIVKNDPILCEGQGSLGFTFSGVPDGNYIIAYDGGNFSNVSVSGNSATVNAPAGTYNNLKITVNSCTSVNGINASISDPNPPSTPTITVQNNCGESVLTASNYTGTLNWSTGESTPGITVTTSGNYTLTQTIDGCTSNAASVSVNINPRPTIMRINENDPSVCQGQGSINFTFTGVPDGTYSIFYDGSSFSGVSVINNKTTVQASAGSYNNLTIIVNGCTSPNGVNANLSDPNPPAAPTIEVKNNCGESVLTASNYTGKLSWSTGESTPEITVTTAGNYSLTQIIDGCTSDAAVAAVAPKTIPEILDLIENNPTECDGPGSLDFTFAGVPDGIYDIVFDGGNFTNVEVTGNSATVETSSGEFNNLIISVDGCVSSSGTNAVLNDPPQPSMPTITVDDNCGETILTASDYTGGLLWSTDENSETITVTAEGEYYLIQQLNGCISDTAKAFATPKPIPQISNVAENNPEVCQGKGSLEFTFTNVPNGTYSIEYDDNSFTNVSVINGKATVQASAGSYSNLVITVNGCISASGVNARLSDPNPPPVPTVDVQDNCGESILTASGYTGTLSWSTGESTAIITVNEPGNYSLIQNVEGCTSDAVIAYASPKIVPEITSVSVDNPDNCEGQGIIEFNFNGIPNGTYTIEYDGGNFTGVAIASNTATVEASSGTYNNLTITIDGCTSSGSINATVTAPTPPTPPTIVVENNCGESILTATDYSGSLNWSTDEDTPSITVTNAGQYTLTQTVGGCTSDAAVAKVAPKAIPVILEITENDPVECQGEGTLDFKFSGVPDGIYTISFDGNSFTSVSVANNTASVPASARNYSNLKISVNGCTSASGINASLSDPNPPPTPAIIVDDFCGESVLTATNYTGSLTWDTGEATQSITVVDAREYSLTQTLDGCTSNAATAFAKPEKSSLKPVVKVTNYCGESEITITNLNENAWLLWQFNNQTDSTQNESITVTESGEYKVYQKLENCISQDSSININLITIPLPPVGTDKEICLTEPLQPLQAEATTSEINTKIVWFNSATGGNEILSPTLNTVGTKTYYAEAVNTATGCVSALRTPVTLSIVTNPKYLLPDTTIIAKPKNNVAVIIFPKDSLKYQWFLNNNEIPNATSQYYYIMESERLAGNTFALEVELQNGCKAKFNYPYQTTDNEINAFKSSEFDNFERLFTIYPNPVNDNLNIAVNSKNIADNSDLNAKIYSIDGKVVLSTQLDQNPKNIDIKPLKTGIYTVVIFNSQTILTSEKLVVTKH